MKYGEVKSVSESNRLIVDARYILISLIFTVLSLPILITIINKIESGENIAGCTASVHSKCYSGYPYCLQKNLANTIVDKKKINGGR
jgi:hypothetical protein